MDYWEMLNRHALISLIKSPEIPDYHLMVGSAENLAPTSIGVAQMTVPKEVAKNLSKFEDMTDEEKIKAIADGTLEVNDFNGNIATIGDGLGGVI